ncbi:hypothetical protein [Haliangium sp.]|uniref:hypothetical protein n=1 Tax=Haliangium sp. TaxID=2663208 RepID=UPI003D10E1E8
MSTASASSSSSDHRSFWKRCSSCKAEIGFSSPYWVCSVSTCTRKRTGMVFCSVACWEVHLPMMRHREAYAVEKRSPSPAEWQRELSEEQASPSDGGATGTSTRRRVAVNAPAEASSSDSSDEVERDILVVASKLKKYIKARSGMNTSDTVLPGLSDHLRALCNAAIRKAAEDGRKTVMDRDLPAVPGRD